MTGPSTGREAMSMAVAHYVELDFVRYCPFLPGRASAMGPFPGRRGGHRVPRPGPAAPALLSIVARQMWIWAIEESSSAARSRPDR